MFGRGELAPRPILYFIGKKYDRKNLQAKAIKSTAEGEQKNGVQKGQIQ